MAKQCPSCSADYHVLFQCDDCPREYCNHCADNAYHPIPIPLDSWGGPCFVLTCPNCGSDSKTVISQAATERAESDSNSGDRGDDGCEYDSSSSSVYSSSDDGSYSSSSSDYSSGADGWAEAVPVVIVVIAVLGLGALASNTYQREVAPENQIRQSSTPNPVAQQSAPPPLRGLSIGDLHNGGDCAVMLTSASSVTTDVLRVTSPYRGECVGGVASGRGGYSVAWTPSYTDSYSGIVSINGEFREGQLHGPVFISESFKSLDGRGGSTTIEGEYRHNRPWNTKSTLVNLNGVILKSEYREGIRVPAPD
jgi:hypothetical protein